MVWELPSFTSTRHSYVIQGLIFGVHSFYAGFLSIFFCVISNFLAKKSILYANKEYDLSANLYTIIYIGARHKHGEKLCGWRNTTNGTVWYWKQWRVPGKKVLWSEHFNFRKLQLRFSTTLQINEFCASKHLLWVEYQFMHSIRVLNNAERVFYRWDFYSEWHQ